MINYLLDANIFIQAKNLHYGFDFCPAFWVWLIENNAAGKVASIEKVADELYAGEDDLSEWAEQRGNAFFLPADAAVVPALSEVSAWASQQSFDPAAISTFLQVADFWLVAHARRMAGRSSPTKCLPTGGVRSRFPMLASALASTASVPMKCSAGSARASSWANLGMQRDQEAASGKRNTASLRGGCRRAQAAQLPARLTDDEGG